MITPEYCRTMARYNTWQNNNLRRVIAGMSEADLRQNRGAFFGSILDTLNHILWGDVRWVSRFDHGDGGTLNMDESTQMAPNATAWAADRFRVDGRITIWAEKVTALDLVGDMTWASGADGTLRRNSVGVCVIQMFNHQTHHRGQVHTMLTAAGQMPGVTDLPFMPDDI